jgi:hypothetical protein
VYLNTTENYTIQKERMNPEEKKNEKDKKVRKELKPSKS